MKCDIIMPIWNQLEFTSDCIKSIANFTKYPYRLILIDNASEGKTRIYLESLLNQKSLDVKIIRNEKNLGFVKAINQGLKESDAPYICIMNNDTLVVDGWLTEMIKIATKNPSIGLVNPSSNNLGQKSSLAEFTKYGESLKQFSGEFIEMGACLGFCMLLKKETFKKMGYFDEIYEVGNFDDTDYSRRVEQAGLVCVRAKGAYVYHRMSKSFLKRKNFDEIFKNNQKIFHKKWGKPKRLLYIMSKDHNKLHEWIKTESIRKARVGNWVWVFLKENSPFEIMEHSNVRKFSLPTPLFKQNCIFRILKRKKKFDSIYVDENELKENLNKLKKFHNADIMLMGG